MRDSFVNFHQRRRQYIPRHHYVCTFCYNMSPDVTAGRCYSRNSDSLESVVTVALGLAEHSGTISITYRQAYMTRITLRSESARSGLSQRASLYLSFATLPVQILNERKMILFGLYWSYSCHVKLLNGTLKSSLLKSAQLSPEIPFLVCLQLLTNCLSSARSRCICIKVVGGGSIRFRSSQVGPSSEVENIGLSYFFVAGIKLVYVIIER